MPHVPTDDERAIAWKQAAEDAGVEPDSVHLFYRPAAENYGAMHYPPGMWAMPQEEFFDLSDDGRQDIYSLRDEHVLIVDAGVDVPKLILLLRHEAEHIAQDAEEPGVGPVAARVAAAVPVEHFYRAMPHERDADAAAAALGRALEVEPSEDERHGPDRYLYSASWPAPDRSSLPRRLLAFVLLMPDQFNCACTQSQTFPLEDPDELLENLVPGGASARVKIGDKHAKALQEIAESHGIDQSSWDEMTLSERNAVTAGLVRQVVERETEVLAEVHQALDQPEEDLAGA